MKRRFLQFSLRRLLGLAAVACLLLGGRHLLETYASHVDVGDTSLGETTVNVRIVRAFGPKELLIHVRSSNLDDPHDGGVVIANFVKRSWLCCYDFECESDELRLPGKKWAFDVWCGDDVYHGALLWQGRKFTAPEK